MKTTISISTIIAIIAITFIEFWAIKHQIDGTILAAALAAIAGLGGSRIRVEKQKRKKEE